MAAGESEVGQTTRRDGHQTLGAKQPDSNLHVGAGFGRTCVVLREPPAVFAKLDGKHGHDLVKSGAMQRVQYFQNYDVDESAELENHPRPADPGGLLLPFDYLGPRTLEILAYRLISAERSGSQVLLMQGVGERGRDLLVLKGGTIETIVQCKNYRDRLSVRQVREELLKVALHACMQPDILPENTAYELWAPGGLSEDAELLLATWPQCWDDERLRTDVTRVLSRYAAFAEMDWDSVRAFVLEDFPVRLKPTRVTGVDLTARVRAKHDLYTQFFGGGVFMSASDVEAAFQRSIVNSGFAALSDTDVRRVTDRILSFSAEERFVTLSSVVLGLSPRLVSLLTQGELDELIRHASVPVFSVVQTIMAACTRLHVEYAMEFRLSAQPCHPALPALVGKLLLFSMLCRVGKVTMGPVFPKERAEYERASIEERLDAHVRDDFQSYQRCIAAYDPEVHRPGSDEELRYRIAVNVLRGADTVDEFIAALVADRDKHRALIEQTHRSWMEIVPQQVLLIADSRSALEDRSLLQRVVDSGNRISELRGAKTPCQ